MDKEVVEEVKKIHAGGYTFVIFGKRGYITQDACFARLNTRISESSNMEMYYVIRPVDGIDFKKIMKQITEIFSIFNFSFEETSLGIFVIEISPKKEIRPAILYNLLNILFCTFRCFDWEYRYYFTGLKTNKDLYAAIYFYIQKSEGVTCHCLNEDLAALYNSSWLEKAIFVFFNTIKIFCNIESNHLVTLEDGKQGYYGKNYIKGQTASFKYLEELYDRYLKENKTPQVEIKKKVIKKKSGKELK